jgi:hypothetical protein
LRFLHGSKIIFLGDFNVTEYITFLNLDQLRDNAVPIFHILSELPIQQHNSITNDNDRLLDLVLSNLHCSVTRGDGDNFNFRAVDMEMVRNALLLIDWSFLEGYPPWFSYELIKKIMLKHRILKKFRVGIWQTV